MHHASHCMLLALRVQVRVRAVRRGRERGEGKRRPTYPGVRPSRQAVD